MGKYYANVTLMVDLFDAKDGDTAGDIINDYITQLALAADAMSDAGVDIAWNDCNFVVFEEAE